jgi:hypothetical protein
MPRNGSGVYSLPPSVNPVVSGTTITATWSNTTLNDIATALTNSFPRDGSGPMTAQAKFFAGTQAVPGLSWAAETTAGLYRQAANTFRYAITSNDYLEIGLNGVLVTDRSNPPVVGEPAPALHRVGYRSLPQRIWNTSTNLILYPSDCGKHIYRAPGTVNGGSDTVSIQSANTFVGYTTTIINRGTDSVTISTTGGIVLTWAGAGTTGTRTLAPFGMATIVLTSATEAIITGVGIT